MIRAWKDSGRFCLLGHESNLPRRIREFIGECHLYLSGLFKSAVIYPTTQPSPIRDTEKSIVETKTKRKLLEMDSAIAYQLESLGLIEFRENRATISCNPHSASSDMSKYT